MGASGGKRPCGVPPKARIPEYPQVPAGLLQAVYPQGALRTPFPLTLRPAAPTTSSLSRLTGVACPAKPSLGSFIVSLPASHHTPVLLTLGADLPPRGRLAVSGNAFGAYDLGAGSGAPDL